MDNQMQHEGQGGDQIGTKTGIGRAYKVRPLFCFWLSIILLTLTHLQHTVYFPIHLCSCLCKHDHPGGSFLQNQPCSCKRDLPCPRFCKDDHPRGSIMKCDHPPPSCLQLQSPPFPTTTQGTTQGARSCTTDLPCP